MVLTHAKRQPRVTNVSHVLTATGSLAAQPMPERVKEQTVGPTDVECCQTGDLGGGGAGFPLLT